MFYMDFDEVEGLCCVGVVFEYYVLEDIVEFCD